MITINKRPKDYEGVFDLPYYELETDNMISSTGVKHQRTIEINGTATVGDKLTVEFDGKSIEFTAANALSGDGVTYLIGSDKEEQAEFIVDAFQVNYYLAQAFEFTVTLPSAGTVLLNVFAKEEGSRFQTSLPQIPAWIIPQSFVSGEDVEIRDNFRLFIRLLCEENANQGDFKLITEFPAVPKFSNKTVFFAVGEFLADQVHPFIPNDLTDMSIVKAEEALKRYYIEYAEQYGFELPVKAVETDDTSKKNILYAGSSKKWRVANNIEDEFVLTDDFLTFRNFAKPLFKDQTDYLLWVSSLTGNIKRKFTVYYQDNTTQVIEDAAFTAVEDNYPYLIPVSYQIFEASLNSTSPVLGFDVEITDGSSSITQKSEFIVRQNRFLEENILYFVSSLGAFEGVGLTGIITELMEPDSETIQKRFPIDGDLRDGEIVDVSHSYGRVQEVNTGIMSKDEMMYLIEFFQSDYKFIRNENGKLERVFVSGNSEIEYYETREGIKSMDIELLFSLNEKKNGR